MGIIGPDIFCLLSKSSSTCIASFHFTQPSLFGIQIPILLNLCFLHLFPLKHDMRKRHPFFSIPYLSTLDTIDKNLMIFFRSMMFYIFVRIMIRFFQNILCYCGNIMVFKFLYFLGFFSLETPIGLPCFKCILDSIVSHVFSLIYNFDSSRGICS